MRQALGWRYPKVLYGRAPRLDARRARLHYILRWYLVPMWQKETGLAQWRPPGTARWGSRTTPPCLLAPPPTPPPHPLPGSDACWQAPHRGAGLVGPGVGQRPCSQAPPPPPDLVPAATWLDVAKAVHALLPLVTDVWWATMPGPRGDPCHVPVTQRPSPYRPQA